MFSKKSNLDALYEALDAYTRETAESLVVPPEFEHTFSSEFETSMQQLISKNNKPCYKYINTVGKRVAGIAVIMLTCLVVALFSVKSLREPFIDFVVKTYEKFTSLFVDKEDYTTEFKVMLPQYIPEGYELEEVPQTDEKAYMCRYVNNNGEIINYIQSINGYYQITVDTEKTTHEKIFVNSIDAVYYTNKNKNCLVLGNGTYTFSISGYISKEELIKIAESIDIK